VPARLRLTLVVATACLVLGLAAVVLLGDTGGGGSASGAGPTGFHGGVKPPAARAGEFALRDQDGRRATMRAYRGRTVVVTFLYSTCQDTCPLTAQQIRGGIDQLGHAVPVLAISVDPAGDTPAHVRRFLVREQLVGRMRYLVGTRSELEPVWRAYGVRPQGQGYEHTAATVIVDAAGRQRVGYLSDQLTPEGLADDLRTLGGGGRAAR
jgi:protein SCO1/2